MKFTDKQLDNWRIYEGIRESGLFNMFDPRAKALTDMDRDEWLFCIEHYNALKQESTKEKAND